MIDRIGNIYSLDSGVLGDDRWTDRSFPVSRTKRGQTDKPDYDLADRGLQFPQNNTAEYVQVLDQMDHRKEFGTPIKLHIHYIQTTAALPIFKIAYKAYSNGEDVPASDTIISTEDGGGVVFPWTGNPMLQIMTFPDIIIPNEGISAQLEFNFYRDDNVVSGDVLVKYIDYHYSMDSAGSDTEYTK